MVNAYDACDIEYGTILLLGIIEIYARVTFSMVRISLGDGSMD
jgi:hypothetical protein